MSTSQGPLFAFPTTKKVWNNRTAHIRRLYDVLQLSLQRRDLPRAKRAWAILARCGEFDWKAMWTTGVELLDDSDGHTDLTHERLSYLRSMMLQNPNDKEHIVQELVLRLIQAGRYKEALDELELYLPSFPYQDNPTLHLYAGLICLFLSQGQGQAENVTSTVIYLRDAQGHLERARALDNGDVVSIAFLEKIADISKRVQPEERVSEVHDSDEEISISHRLHFHKRLKT